MPIQEHPARKYGYVMWALLRVEGISESLQAAYNVGRAEADLDTWLHEERSAAQHSALSDYSPDFISERVGLHAGRYMEAVLALDSAHASLLKLATDAAKAEDRRRRQRIKRQVRAELRTEGLKP